MEVAQFLVEAGARTGLGHLQRSLALALGLREAGIESRFVLQGDPAVAVRVAERGYAVDMVGDAAEWPAVAARSLTGQATDDALVVTDGYGIGPDLHRSLRAAGWFVAAIDDLAAWPSAAHVVVNGGVDAAALPYASEAGDTLFLLGPRYALLLPEFSSVRPPARRAGAARVLVTLGGSDPQGATPRLLASLDRLPEPFELIAVLGPFAAHRGALPQAAGRCRHAVRLIEAAPEMATLMACADVAVSAGGQTLSELACVGCPAVAIEAAANQRAQISALARLGVVHSAGRADDAELAEAVAEAVSALLRDGEARDAMGLAGRRLIDGSGARRAAGALRDRWIAWARETARQ